jgi:hypothetical protein
VNRLLIGSVREIKDNEYRVGLVHYCVANMPGAVPRTSTFALTNVTLPYLVLMANRGLAAAIKQDPSLAPGVNTYAGKLTCARGRGPGAEGDSPGRGPAGLVSYSTPNVISSTGMKWLSLCPKIP